MNNRSFQHERASIEMFDYMIEANGLMPSFEHAGLDENDLILVKELIYGQLNEENPTNSVRHLHHTSIAKKIVRSLRFGRTKVER